ncbi:MAG: hypothetical protein ACM3X6_06910 [Patescibacteria group bacterium]
MPRISSRSLGAAGLSLCLSLAACGCKFQRAVPDAHRIITGEQKTACNAVMGGIKLAAEAMYAAEGRMASGPIDANSELVGGGYLAGAPYNPHGFGTYSVTWSGSSVVVVCPTGCKYPPGH